MMVDICYFCDATMHPNATEFVSVYRCGICDKKLCKQHKRYVIDPTTLYTACFCVVCYGKREALKQLKEMK